MTGTIGLAVLRSVAAEAEILGPRRIDRPATSVLFKFEQGATVSFVNMLVDDRGFRFAIDLHEHCVLLPWVCREPPPALNSPLATTPAASAACEVQAGEFADDGVAADADVGGDLTAGEAGFKMALQELDAFVGPGWTDGRHVDGPRLRIIVDHLVGFAWPLFVFGQDHPRCRVSAAPNVHCHESKAARP